MLFKDLLCEQLTIPNTGDYVKTNIDMSVDTFDIFKDTKLQKTTFKKSTKFIILDKTSKGLELKPDDRDIVIKLSFEEFKTYFQK